MTQQQGQPGMVGATSADKEFLVACLCAEWCGSCREYRQAFDALAARMHAARFVWVDVEDEPELAGDIDVDNFPTLVIQRQIGEASPVLFCGAMLPHIGQLERLLETLMAQTASESLAYAKSPQRLPWQEVGDIGRRLAERGEP